MRVPRNAALQPLLSHSGARGHSGSLHNACKVCNSPKIWDAHACSPLQVEKGERFALEPGRTRLRHQRPSCDTVARSKHAYQQEASGCRSKPVARKGVVHPEGVCDFSAETPTSPFQRGAGRPNGGRFGTASVHSAQLPTGGVFLRSLGVCMAQAGRLVVAGRCRRAGLDRDFRCHRRGLSTVR